MRLRPRRIATVLLGLLCACPSPANRTEPAQPASASAGSTAAARTSAADAGSTEGIFATTDGVTSAGGAVTMDELFLSSGTNANDRYHLMARSRGTPPAELRFLLRLGGRVVSTGSGGHDATFWNIDFTLDRAMADAAARHFAIARKDRRRLGDGLRFHYELRAIKPRAKSPLPLVLVLENGGTEAVTFTDGGGHRGSDRENRYVFVVSKDGVQQPDIGSSANFGGLATIITLEPGKSHAMRDVDLTKWGAFDRPGVYEVTCRYELVLQAHASLDWATANERWDFPAEEKIKVEIAP